MIEKIIARYPISQIGTRNRVLMQLVGDLVHKFGREAAEQIVAEHYRRNQLNVRSCFDEHKREFGAAWDGMRAKLVKSLSPPEQQAFNRLRTNNQRDAFLIVRAFARAAARKGEPDFEIGRASLADRLRITPPGASDVIGKLRQVDAIIPIKPYVMHKACARFGWLFDLKVSDSCHKASCADKA